MIAAAANILVIRIVMTLCGIDISGGTVGRIRASTGLVNALASLAPCCHDRRTLYYNADTLPDVYMLLTIDGRELVKAGKGAVNAWRITPTIRDEKGQSEGDPLGLWITDDARRLPVKLEAELLVGSFRLTLREAR